MRKKLKRFKKTAHHEAGHAVARHFLHLPYRYVTIESDEESLGHVERFPYPKSFCPDIDSENYRVRKRIEKEIIASFAGHAAEFILSKRKNWKGARQDNHETVDLALYYCGGSTEEAGAFLDWMWLRTIGWIKNPLRWMCVKKVAKELLEKHKLKATEVRKIIKEAIHKKFDVKKID